jgi:hypothetical protein
MQVLEALLKIIKTPLKFLLKFKIPTKRREMLNLELTI